MSVILFSQDSIARVESAVLYAFKYLTHHSDSGRSIRDAIIYSNYFAKRFSFELRLTQKAPTDELTERIGQEVIGRLFWYVWCANKVAHALQYRQEPKFFEDVEKQEVKPEPTMPAHKILEDLRHIRYNLVTNDGHLFLSKDWEEILDAIINGLANHFARRRELSPTSTSD